MLLLWTRLGVLFVSIAAGITGVAAQAGSGEDNPSNLVGHGGPIKAITISANGQLALSGSFDYSAALWALGNQTPNKLLRRYSDHDGAVNAVEFIEGSNRFISAGDDGSIYVWNTQSEKMLFRFKGHQAKVIALAVSGNGKIAASASWDRTVGLWDLQNFKPMGFLKHHRGPVNAVLISDDGETAYSGSYDGLILASPTRSNKPAHTLHRHGWGINVMKWLPAKSQILFGTQNGDVQIYDLATGAISKILIPHQRPVLALAVSKDGRFLASGGGDGIIRVWKISDWSVVEELDSSFGPVWSMDFSIDSKKIYYSGLDDYAVAWTISPRRFGDEIQGKFPRRFQKSRDMSPGELQFARKCSICHTLTPGDQNRAGPSLHGIFGRVAGTLENYNYSAGLTKSKIVWNEETIDQLFALGPQHVTPGSKMPLQKIDSREKRDALISFLKASTR